MPVVVTTRKGLAGYHIPLRRIAVCNRCVAARVKWVLTLSVAVPSKGEILASTLLHSVIGDTYGGLERETGGRTRGAMAASNL